MSKNYSRSLTEELQDLANHFPTQPRAEYLRSALEYLQARYDGDAIRSIFARAVASYDKFPTLRQFDEIAKDFYKVSPSKLTGNNIYCRHCDDRGYLFAVHRKTNTQTCYYCEKCSFGEAIKNRKTLPGKNQVISLGYCPVVVS